MHHLPHTKIHTTSKFNLEGQAALECAADKITEKGGGFARLSPTENPLSKKELEILEKIFNKTNFTSSSVESKLGRRRLSLRTDPKTQSRVNTIVASPKMRRALSTVFKTSVTIEPISFIRYTSGGEFPTHRDGKNYLHVIGAFIIQLGDKYTGGHFWTVGWKKFQGYKPNSAIDRGKSKKGEITIIPTEMFHRVEPIISGQRDVVTAVVSRLPADLEGGQ